ncbi:MAG TPA: hypothetical protein ENG03_08550 [Thioploca sp.]|nr:MAG: hypothetical protein DRR19_08500 [Gammaproteobacteria bacterium]HDN27129.1 hypothetical protein [Thioploca sp.]
MSFLKVGKQKHVYPPYMANRHDGFVSGQTKTRLPTLHGFPGEFLKVGKPKHVYPPYMAVLMIGCDWFNPFIHVIRCTIHF